MKIFYIAVHNVHNVHNVRNVYNVHNVPQQTETRVKSSKIRLLPSKSGVLIEFQSEVFTGKSRAISGLKLEFSPS